MIAGLACLSLAGCKKEPFQELHEAVTAANAQISDGSLSKDFLDISKVDYDEVDNTVKVTVTGGKFFMADPSMALTAIKGIDKDLYEKITAAKANFEVTYEAPGMDPATMELEYKGN